jgi:hypothetical protein
LPSIASTTGRPVLPARAAAALYSDKVSSAIFL